MSFSKKIVLALMFKNLRVGDFPLNIDVLRNQL